MLFSFIQRNAPIREGLARALNLLSLRIARGSVVQGTNESVLIEVLTTRSNAELRAARAHFEAKHGRSLLDIINSETGGDFRKTLQEILKCERNENDEVDPQLASEQATALYKAGKGKIGTDEKVFIQICTSQSRAQLQAVKTAYEQ